MSVRRRWMMAIESVLEPAWLTINNACRYAGCGRSSLYLAIADGRVEARSAFGRTLVRRISIDAYLNAAPLIGSSSAIAVFGSLS